MASANEERYFDVEFFMKSTDVGLYNVTKNIFSYLSAFDLKEMRKINKNFNEFLKNEEDFLTKKFEKVKLHLPGSVSMSAWIQNYSYKTEVYKLQIFSLLWLSKYPFFVTRSAGVVFAWVQLHLLF